MECFSKGYVNCRCGEIEVMIGGEWCVFCFMLGGFVELEMVFGLESLNDFVVCFLIGCLKVVDMICIIGVGLCGGGNLLLDEDVGEMEIEGGLVGVVRIVVELLFLVFGL